MEEETNTTEQEINRIIAPLARRLHLAWRHFGSGLFTLPYEDFSNPTDYHIGSVVLCQREMCKLAEPVYVGLIVADSFGNVGIESYVKGPAKDLERWRRSLPAIGGEWRLFEANEKDDKQVCAMTQLLTDLPPCSDKGYEMNEDVIQNAVRTLCDYVSGCIRVDYRLFSSIVAKANHQPVMISHTDYNNSGLKI